MDPFNPTRLHGTVEIGHIYSIAETQTLFTVFQHSSEPWTPKQYNQTPQEVADTELGDLHLLIFFYRLTVV